MPIEPNDSVMGVKYATIVFSFLGSAMSLSYAKEMTKPQAITAIVTGATVAVMAAPMALHYLALPDTFERAVGFFGGLGAMRLVPVFFALIDRLRDIRLPWLSDTKAPPADPMEPKE